MVVAARGTIKQVNVEDWRHPKSWDQARTIAFGLQLIDASSFRQIIGIPPLPSPVNAEVHANHGYSSYKLYKDDSGIAGYSLFIVLLVWTKATNCTPTFVGLNSISSSNRCPRSRLYNQSQYGCCIRVCGHHGYFSPNPLYRRGQQSVEGN